MSKKILVVDDDPVIIRLVQSFLSSKGFEVVTAYDGLDALVQIKRESPELVVLDIEMPEINGYDVCHELRFNSDFDKIPIILLTIREQELDERLGKKINIEYLPKPVDTNKLLEKINQMI